MSAMSGTQRGGVSPAPASASVSAPDFSETPRGAGPAPVVLVTGGARRIGRAFALGFAARGWDVAVHYGASRDEAADVVAQIEALGRRATRCRRISRSKRRSRDSSARAGRRSGASRAS
jgi:hypothetical protein